MTCRTCLLILVLGLIAPARAAEPAPDLRRADRLMNDGNFAEAVAIYQVWLLNPDFGVGDAARVLSRAVQCLRRVNQPHEAIELVETVVEARSKDWRVLQQAAQIYVQDPHVGYIVGGEFMRGRPRGGNAEHAHSIERDRVRAMQLMAQAMPLAQAEAEQARSEVGQFYLTFAQFVLGYRQFQESWRLQYLTDLATLPDVEPGYAWHWWGHRGGRGGGGEARGAPTDAEGNPVFHRIPPSWEEAETDGERWRWLLMQAAEVDAGRLPGVQLHFAQFLYNQFGVQTMAGLMGQLLAADLNPRDGEPRDLASAWDVRTLEPTESMARLAVGARRFDLPDEFNYIRILGELASQQGTEGARAADLLARIFTNRQQYPRAADLWREAIRGHGPGNNRYRERALDHILGHWGRFERAETQAARTGAKVDFVFRNATEVTFEARALDTARLLEDVRQYLRSNPSRVNLSQMQIEHIGNRIFEDNRAKYIGRQEAQWTLALDPRPEHLDRRITVSTPLQRPGAYLVTARVRDGNESHIVLWVADTVIAKKPLARPADAGEPGPKDGQPAIGQRGPAWIYVADAVSGRPVPDAHLEFFGWRTRWEDRGRRQVVETREFAARADADGQFMGGDEDFDQNYQWLITATTPEGRFAYLGFQRMWSRRWHDAEYNATQAYYITDRPVYRPGHTVHIKAWVRQAQYDKGDESRFAGQSLQIQLYDARGQRVWVRNLRADAWGGVETEFELPEDAPLGVYRLSTPAGRIQGRGTFRVEEYRTPEFEVSVQAPDKPVALGDRLEATVEARYYFGAPVTNARVAYKVERVPHETRWFAPRPWDWFYGPGYWWFAYDYDWYPGWGRWGCWAPWPWWLPERRTPPELVAEGEAAIGEDGRLVIPIDTSLAKALHGDLDHRYTVTAEVTDASRRTIVGTGQVIAARRPFQVYTWVNRGYYRVGDTIRAGFSARTPDRQPVAGGEGEAVLYRVTYDEDRKPQEREVRRWPVELGPDGQASLQIAASAGGQYRLACTIRDAEGREIEGAYVFIVRGEGFDGRDYRFSQIEIVPDQAEYAPGDTARLLVNVDREDATVMLFLRPANGIYLPPRVIRMEGRSAVVDLPVVQRDMPNLFVEAVTVADARVHTATRELVVPPERRILGLEVRPDQERYRPGEGATVRIALTDAEGQPFQGTAVVTIYDKAVEYISGGSNVPDIREYFWKWRRRHHPQTEHSLTRFGWNLTRPGQRSMSPLGVFGGLVADEQEVGLIAEGRGRGERMLQRAAVAAPAAAPGRPMMEAVADAAALDAEVARDAAAEPVFAEAHVRTRFADTAHWTGAVTTDENGEAEIELPMPENLTTWVIRSWAMGHGTRVGEGRAEVVTSKNLILRLQAPRFFVEKDEAVLSANIHNYLEADQPVRAILELEGGVLEPLDEGVRNLEVAAGGEARVDWRVRATGEGEATIRMKALAPEESDAMEMSFPVYIHGMLKQEAWSGALRPADREATVRVRVPEERRVDESRLEVRYSPTLAGAMVDALPYLVDYPYGTTDQTLNRWLPTALTQKVLRDMGIDLAAVAETRANLNAQELGDPEERAAQWRRYKRNPVFDEDVVADMVRDGLKALARMQLADGGWGWFSGRGERSSPHLTALVVHGLHTAEAAGVAVVADMKNRGLAWLARYEAERLRELRRKDRETRTHATDAFVFMVLSDARRSSAEMRDFLYRDRLQLPVYVQALFGLGLDARGDAEMRDMVIRNLSQYVVRVEENQTAYLNLGNQGYWWWWYGSEYEAHAAYLRLLVRTDPENPVASEMVKYLLNNRKHATYWNSTRDTAMIVEAFAEYLKATGEMKPDLEVEILVNGRVEQTVRITPDNLFGFRDRFVLEGDAVETGEHTITLRKTGEGPLYFNAYLTTFTLEDEIGGAGLEVKVDRQVYRLERVEAEVKTAGAHGQVGDQKVERYERIPLQAGDVVESGQLIEVELVFESLNDYEYIVLEDYKAAGFEPVDVQSGYPRSGFRAYREFRDERVAFFIRRLARGRQSVSYRLRAETPGTFGALPARIEAMYAPELKGNSDSIRLGVRDRE